MGRRRELDNVGDGITGHFMLDRGWNPGWQFAHVARALRVGDGATFTVNLLNGAVFPASVLLVPLATELQSDFRRHLAVRSIPITWVVLATFEVAVENWTPGRDALVLSRVTIRDDLGQEHTSTRRGGLYVPRSRLRDRLRELIRRQASR